MPKDINDRDVAALRLSGYVQGLVESGALPRFAVQSLTGYVDEVRVSQGLDPAFPLVRVGDHTPEPVA